jgi:hypothetical protein
MPIRWWIVKVAEGKAERSDPEVGDGLAAHGGDGAGVFADGRAVVGGEDMREVARP